MPLRTLTDVPSGLISITLAVKAFPVIETIFWAYPITWGTSCVVFLIYYLKTDWVHSFDRENKIHTMPCK